jgi:Protein of unknown function (DUF3343).
MRAEAVLKRCGIQGELVPTPREFSSDCGVSLRFAFKDADAVVDALCKAKVDVAQICL